MLRLPCNSNLAKPSRGRANGPVSETVPRPFRDRSETASVQASQPRWFAHSPEAQFTRSASVFCILPSPSSQRVDAAPCESAALATKSILDLAAPATKSILDLAKVLRLPRNLYLTLRKCCACHAIQTLRNLRAAVPMGPSPRPFRDCSETAPPYRRRSRGGLRTVRKPNSRTAPTFSASCHPPARREWTQHLAKVLRLPRNRYLTLRKCCACHEIYT